MKATRLVTPLLTLAILSTILAGRAAADVRDEHGAALSLEALPIQREPGTGDALIVRVAFAGLRAREVPAGPETGQPFAFLDSFSSSTMATAGGQPYTLLVKTTDDGQKVSQAIGWVNSRYLVTTNHAEEDAATKLYKKAMVTIPLERIRQDVERHKSDPTNTRFGAVEPRLGPSARAATTGEMIRLFNLFFIYGEADGYYLLGRRPFFNAGGGRLEEARRVILGWLPRERVSPWLNRETLYWTPDRPEGPRRKLAGVAFETPTAALAALTRSPGGGGNVITVENPLRPNLFGKELSARQMRFPVLGYGEPRKVPGNEMLKIGAFSGLRGVREDGSEQRELSEEEIARITDEMEKLGIEARRVEVLFVVDETTSIKPWFKVVAETVKRITQPIVATRAGDSGPEVRLAVAFYGDTYGGSQAATPARLTTPAEFVRDVLPGLPTHPDKFGGDALERVYHGLRQAINGAGFTPAVRKLVILIGDMGNKHVAGDPTAENLAALLVRPDDNTWTSAEFYAVQVGRKESVERFTEAKQFRTEMRNLSNRVRQLIAAKYRARGGDLGTLSDFVNVYSPEAADGMIKSILDRYTKLRLRVLSIGDQLDALRLTYDSRISVETEHQLIARGVPIDELRKIRGAQVFQEGYVWRNNADRQEQVRGYLLIHAAELDSFLRETAGLELTPDQLGHLSVPEFLLKLIASMGGDADADRDKPLNELLRLKTGFTLKSPLFNIPIANIDNVRLRRQDLVDIVWKRKVLRDILDARQRRWVAREVDLGGGQKVIEHDATTAVKYKQRGFYMQGESRVKWYWIDMKDEWP